MFATRFGSIFLLHSKHSFEKVINGNDTKRAIWSDQYNRHISIFYTKYMRTYFSHTAG